MQDLIVAPFAFALLYFHIKVIWLFGCLFFQSASKIPQSPAWTEKGLMKANEWATDMFHSSKSKNLRNQLGNAAMWWVLSAMMLGVAWGFTTLIL